MCWRVVRRLAGEHCLLVVCGGLALGKGDRSGRARGQAVAQPVAVIIPQELCLAAHHADSAFVTSRRASAAAVAFFFVNLNDLPQHPYHLLDFTGLV